MSNSSIYLVGGSKGGVGKSMMSFALIDYLGEKNVVLIETDTSNPDVFRSLEKKAKNAHPIALDDRNGWLDLVDAIDAAGSSPVVMNTRAANNVGMASFGDLLIEASKLISKPIVVFWVLNTDKDGVALLKAFLKQFQENDNIKIHVVMNEMFGKEEQFFYSVSETSKVITSRGGHSIFMPELAERARVQLYNERKTFAEIAETGSLGVKMEASRWRNKMREQLDKTLKN